MIEIARHSETLEPLVVYRAMENVPVGAPARNVFEGVVVREVIFHGFVLSGGAHTVQLNNQEYRKKRATKQ